MYAVDVACSRPAHLLVTALLALRLGIVLVLLRPFAHLALVGQLGVERRENEVEDLVIPGHGVALDALLDVLSHVLAVLLEP